VLRHTFCTHLADAGADTAVIRELAGHADIRTTTIYTAVNPSRLEHAIAERGRRNRGVPVAPPPAPEPRRRALADDGRNRRCTHGWPLSAALRCELER
jgi:hypothetical protein